MSLSSVLLAVVIWFQFIFLAHANYLVCLVTHTQWSSLVAAVRESDQIGVLLIPVFYSTEPPVARFSRQEGIRHSIVILDM